MTTSTSAQRADTSVTKVILDLNSSKFDPEYYVQDLLQKKGLEELVAVEQDMVNNVRRLDSEMQSLVYENYSKFLNATSTVRDMQTRLVDTHNEMRDLSARVQRITDLSDNLTEKFAKNCEKVKKLNEAKNSVKRLEFLIKAPQILKNFIEQGQLTKAVDSYLAIRPKLEKFRDIPSIGGISKDVEEIIEGIKEQFSETLNGRLLSSEEVIEAATMLKKLEIPERDLEKQLLANWGREMTSELEQLKANAKLENGRFPDIFEFVDIGCCHFLTNLSLMASTFLQLFPKQNSKMELVHLLEKLMDHFELILNERFELERNTAECALFVKALDRIYRKISVLTRLSSGFNFSRMNSEIVQRFAKHQIMVCRQSTLETTEKTIEEVLSRLNHSPPAQSSSKSDNGRSAPTTAFSKGIRQDRKELLRKSLEKLESGFVHSVKSSLAALLMFTASDIIFPTIPHFSPFFGFDVHQQIVVGSMKDLVEQIQKRAKTSKLEGEKGQEGANGVEILVLCTFLRNLQLKHLDYLMELCREQYKLSEFHFAEQNKLTEGNELAEEMKGEVEILLRKFVQVQSGALIQLVRKSIDLFEWAATSESPRKVRNLIRHLVHSVEEIDADLAVFMDDGGLAKTKEHKQRTPDSLHSFPTIRRAASGASSISLSSGGIVERLWADSDPMEENNLGESAAVETAATIPVEFRRDVIVNGIVRLMLRAMCEFTRDQSFSVEGLEQMQVDCAFMRQKLWASVGDEHMLNTLIEDVLTAAVNQCAHPKLLDPSVLRSICEEN